MPRSNIVIHTSEEMTGLVLVVEIVQVLLWERALLLSRHGGVILCRLHLGLHLALPHVSVVDLVQVQLCPVVAPPPVFRTVLLGHGVTVLSHPPVSWSGRVGEAVVDLVHVWFGLVVPHARLWVCGWERGIIWLKGLGKLSLGMVVAGTVVLRKHYVGAGLLYGPPARLHHRLPDEHGGVDVEVGNVHVLWRFDLLQAQRQLVLSLRPGTGTQQH